VLPKGTDAPEGAEAVDSAFATGEGEELNVSVDGDNVQLQQVKVEIPAGAGLTGEPSSLTRICWWSNLEKACLCICCYPSVCSMSAAHGSRHSDLQLSPREVE